MQSRAAAAEMLKTRMRWTGSAVCLAGVPPQQERLVIDTLVDLLDGYLAEREADATR
jgi:hypothetical protein